MTLVGGSTTYFYLGLFDFAYLLLFIAVQLCLYKKEQTGKLFVFGNIEAVHMYHFLDVMVIYVVNVIHCMCCRHFRSLDRGCNLYSGTP